LWKIGSLEFVIIECKSGGTSGFIAKNDAEQLSGSVDWFKSKYDKTWSEPIPVMIHRSPELHAAASPCDGMRVITFERLDQLRETVSTYGRALAADGGFRDAKRIGEHLEDQLLAGKAFIAKWSVAIHK
jgi:hypothetical protein